MKSASILLCFLIQSFILTGQTWTWSSDNPAAGSEINVTVKDIDIDEDMHVVGYYFKGNDIVASDITFIEEKNSLKLTLRVPETSWLRLVVKNKNNQPVTADNRDILWAGAKNKSSLIDFANATAAYYRLLGLERNEMAAATMYREAILAHPEWLDNPVVLRSYYNMSKAIDSKEDMDRIRTYVLACEAAPDPASQDMLITALRIAKETGDTVLQKSLRKKLDASYPQSIVAQEDHLTLFRKASSLSDKITLREQYRTSFPLNEFNRSLHDQMTSELVQQCAQMEDYEKMQVYIDELLDPSTKASVCNNYAWSLAGEGIENEGKNLGLAARLSAESLTLLTPAMKKPATMSQSEWERNLEFSKAMYGDTYALILFKQGKYDDALSYQEKAVRTYGYADIEMNDRYAQYLMKAGKKEQLLSFVEDMIRKGNASREMKNMHEEIWTREKSQQQLYDQYIGHLESEARIKKLEEIKGMWMEATSTPFTLKNLDGKAVSLSDFKGKTIVLDFWATWCGPCKASFPGMKNAVEHFATDNSVVFLFVDTWESGPDELGKVKKFISDHKYPFHVLMDVDDTVVTQYKVDGIPTKFIIGPDQKIRFKSTGFDGNNEMLVEELITMIEMTKNGGKMLTP